MAKLRKATDAKGNHSGYIHYCPGCRMSHLFDKRWKFNMDLEKPTFQPSMLVNKDRIEKTAPRCHYFLRNGVIEYLSDCTHELANKNILLTDIIE